MELFSLTEVQSILNQSSITYAMDSLYWTRASTHKVPVPVQFQMFHFLIFILSRSLKSLNFKSRVFQHSSWLPWRTVSRCLTVLSEGERSFFDTLLTKVNLNAILFSLGDLRFVLLLLLLSRKRSFSKSLFKPNACQWLVNVFHILFFVFKFLSLCGQGLILIFFYNKQLQCIQCLRESSFNMTRGDEDIETQGLKF